MRINSKKRTAPIWVNEISDESFSFFSLEIELWRVDESLPAPKFNIVSKPNDWSRTVSSSARAGSSGPSEAGLKQLKYWQELKNLLKERNSFLKIAKAQPQNWISLGLGRSNFSLGANTNSFKGRITVELYLDGD